MGPTSMFLCQIPKDCVIDQVCSAFFNDVTYVGPKVPSLYTALSVGTTNAANPRVYGSNSLAQILKHGDVVELVLNNGDDGKHPFHLHGHNFQVVYRSDEDAGDFVNDGSIELPRYPMRRDTVFVQGNGNFVIRFVADNPGVWLFHCHIEWHMDQGLIATIVVAPEAIQGLEIPSDHYDACRAVGAPIRGNAAGNIMDVLDLTGENRPPPPLPAGFTAKGYVALFFSCISAIIGLLAISWYEKSISCFFPRTITNQKTRYGVIDPGAKESNVESQNASAQEQEE